MSAEPTRWRLLAALLAGALLITGCSGGDDLPDLGEPEGTTPTSGTTTSTAPTTTTSTEPQPADGNGSDDPDDPDQAVLDTWTTLLDAARTGAPDPDQTATIQALADDGTAQQLLNPFFPEAPTRQITYHPALTPQQDGTVAIDDCIIMDRGITADLSNWLIATAVPDDTSPTGWIITQLTVPNLDPCVPRSIAQAAIDGYEAHWDARAVFLDPPDPGSPELLATTTGEQLDLFRTLLPQLRADGQTTRGARHQTRPEVFEVSSPVEIVLIDCQDTNPEYGIFDIETGERTTLVPPVRDGQLDLRQTTMRLEGGTWKVSSTQGETDVQCRTPPTPPTIQVAGG